MGGDLRTPDPRGGGSQFPSDPGDTLAVPGPGGPKTVAEGCKSYTEIPEGDPETCDPLTAVGKMPCGLGEYWSAVDDGCRCLGHLELDGDTGMCRSAAPRSSRPCARWARREAGPRAMTAAGS